MTDGSIGSAPNPVSDVCANERPGTITTHITAKPAAISRRMTVLSTQAPVRSAKVAPGKDPQIPAIFTHSLRVLFRSSQPRRPFSVTI